MKTKRMRCDYCGDIESKKELKNTFVNNSLQERFARVCIGGDENKHSGNPVFQNEMAWDKWRKKYSLRARNVLATGLPTFQYSGSIEDGNEKMGMSLAELKQTETINKPKHKRSKLSNMSQKAKQERHKRIMRLRYYVKVKGLSPEEAVRKVDGVNTEETLKLKFGIRPTAVGKKYYDRVVYWSKHGLSIEDAKEKAKTYSSTRSKTLTGLKKSHHKQSKYYISKTIKLNELQDMNDFLLENVSKEVLIQWIKKQKETKK